MRHGTSNNRRNNRSRNNNNNNGGMRRNNNQRTQVYDSNGPDVRIRGTAHQVAEKYLALAKDSLSLGDRMIAENYFQHAEHYIRIINEMSASDANNIKGVDKAKPISDDEGNRQDKSVEVGSVKSEAVEDLSLPASILGSAVANSEKKKEEVKEVESIS